MLSRAPTGEQSQPQIAKAEVPGSLYPFRSAQSRILFFSTGQYGGLAEVYALANTLSVSCG